MSDNLQPLPDEHLEARITAYVLGEASPFEAAELESLIENSPELKLFLNRTRTLHTLLAEAETTANKPTEEWKLPQEKRNKLDQILGQKTPLEFSKAARIRRASFRAAIGIAAIFLITVFSAPMVIRQRKMATVSESATIVNYMAQDESELDPEALRQAIRVQEDKVEERRKILTTISRTKDIAYYAEKPSESRRDELSAEQLAKVEAKMAESKGNALERQITPEDYADAKRDFQTEQAQLEQMKRRLGGEEIPAPALLAANERNQRGSDARRRENAPAPASEPLQAAEAPTNIPLPDQLALLDKGALAPGMNFGEGAEFGDGWGEGKAANRESEIANASGRSEPISRPSVAPAKKAKSSPTPSPAAMPVPSEELAKSADSDMDAFSDSAPRPPR